MDDVFLSLLNMSFTSSIVIFAVLVIRLLLKKTPKIFSYALWAVVLFRLLCPFSFESAVGLLPSTEVIPQDIVYEAQPEISTGFEIIDSSVNEILPPATPTASVNPIQIWIFIGRIIWGIGVLAMLIYSIIQYALLKRRLIGAKPLSENICKTNNVFVADGIDSPFVMGLLKPKIYLPSTLPKNEYDFIIAHEKCHIKRLDHITRVLAFIALALHWFNPLVWVSYIISAKDMEMSCDETVMKNMNSDIRAEYSTSLLRIATGKKLMFATPLAFGEGDTKGRVENVMKYKKPVVWVSVICLILVGVIAVSLMSNAKKEEFISSSISFSDEKEFEFTLYEANTTAGFGNTFLNKGDEVKISIWSESEAEIQVGIMPTDEFDNTNREEFVGETVLLTKEPQEILVEVPQNDMYKVSFINTTNKEVLAAGTVVYNTNLNDITPITAMITEIDRENYTMKVEPLDSSSVLTSSITLDVATTTFTNGTEDGSIENFSVGYLVDIYVNLTNVVDNTMFPLRIDMNGDTNAISLLTLWENRTQYVGDNSAVGNIISNLPLPQDVNYENFSLDTDESPFGIAINFVVDEDISNVANGNISGFAEKTSAILFSLVGNVDNVSFDFSDGYSMLGISFYREDIESIYGEDLFSKTQTQEHFELLFNEIYDDNNDAPLNAIIPMVMIDGRILIQTGNEDFEFIYPAQSNFDGEITSSVPQNQKPTQDDQSNFGENYFYAYINDGGVAVYIDNNWVAFEPEEKAPLELFHDLSADGEIELAFHELPSYSFKTNSEQINITLNGSEEMQVRIMLYDANSQDAPVALFNLTTGEVYAFTNLTSATNYIIRTVLNYNDATLTISE